MKNTTSYLMLAALVALAAYFAIAIMGLSEKNDGIMQNFKAGLAAYPNVLTGASRGEAEADSELQEIMAAYERGDYPASIKDISRYLKNHPDSYRLKFYRGISYLNNREPARAIKDFQDVILAGGDFKDDAEWYLALAYLDTESKMTALELFGSIAQKENEYSAKAREALGELKALREQSLKKIFELTDQGKFVYFFPKEENPTVRPITERTLYLEASASGVIPSEVSYNEFVRMPVVEKQNLLKANQDDAYSAMSPDNKELFSAMLAALPKPAMTLPVQPAEETVAANESSEGTQPDNSEAAVENVAAEVAENTDTTAEHAEDPKITESRMPLQPGLPWIVDAMLRAETGKELPDDFTDLKGENDKEVSWVVDLITNKISDQ